MSSSLDIQARLLPLALLSLEEPDAIAVLSDAVQEVNWYDGRVLLVMLGDEDPPRFERTPRRSVRWTKIVAAPTADWARAVAAVLLFGGWSRYVWPLEKQLSRREQLAERLQRRSFSDIRSVRKFPLSFPTTHIAAGATVRVQTQAQVPFRGQRLAIPSDIEEALLINDLLVGKTSIFQTKTPIPARVFCEMSVGVDLNLPVAYLGQIITLDVTNISGYSITFNACLIGTRSWSSADGSFREA